MAVADRVDVRLALRDRAELVERCYHRLARLGDRQAREALAGRLVHAPVLADHRDLLEPVLAPDLEVVRVVTGSDLERAGAELGIDVVVRDDRQAPADQRQDRGLADQVDMLRASSGFTATATSASIVSGRTVATVTWPSPDSSG